MQQNVQLRAINIKVMFLSALVVLPLVGLIALFAKKISYTTNQTYFIITCASIIAIINFIIIKKYSRLVNFLFSNSENLLTISKENSFIKIPYSDINNYNIYYLLIKKMGYIIRIQGVENYYFWINFKNFEKKTKIDDENYDKIKNYFIEIGINKKKTLADYIILLLASLPWVMLIMGLLSIIGIFYYIFFMI
ncbi:hypothetical protein ETU10_01140 [Apibacter muscae]|uniref:hypothetical protein n=1 Tax=Apibacter muscae TaxID=2509004 RepID=UPI0011AB9E2F|nr:hypothetical protein [Apibacter muscae]TWP25268.1 hypothetical protein ETU10_01140 [Apibacter muscae]